MKLPLATVCLLLSGSLIGNVFALSGNDDYQSYSSLTYGNNGGTGLGAHTYLEGTGGGIFLDTSVAAIDGSKSLGIFASTGGQALYRSTTAGSIGTYTASARFNLDNSVAFSGLNLKSAAGTTFGGSELVSWGLLPANGNTVISVFGATNFTINLGTEVRGPIIDFQLDWNSTAATFTLGAKFRTSGTFTTVSGALKDTNGATAGTGDVAALGFGNFNTGTNQNLIVDSLSIVPEPSTIALLGLSGFGMIRIFRRKSS